MNHPNDLHYFDDLMPEEVRERMRTRSKERTPSMPTFHADPQAGSDANDGLSPSTAVRTLPRLNELLRDRPAGGARVLLRGEHVGTLQVVGGSPEARIEIGNYGPAPATIRSGAARGVEIYGYGGVSVRGLRVVGERAAGVSGVEFWNGQLVGGGPASDLLFEDLEISGYGIAGLAVSPFDAIRNVTVRGVHAHGNASGVLIGGYTPQLPRGVQDLYVSGCDLSDNDWTHGPTNIAGYGLAISGASGVVEFCVFNRNGRYSMSPGHGGFIGTACDGLVVRRCHAADNHDPNPAHGDGSGFLFCESVNCSFEDCVSERNAAGFTVFTDNPPTHRPEARSVWVLRCRVADNTTGVAVVNRVSDTWVVGCEVTARTGPGRTFAKALDVSDHVGVGVRVEGNRFSALGDAWLLQLSGPPNLSGVRLDGNAWDASRAAAPVFFVYDRLFSRFAEWAETGEA